MQLGKARLKSQTALVFFKLTKLEQTAQSARDGSGFGHCLDLRRKLGELGD
jgi:hypothetical protein